MINKEREMMDNREDQKDAIPNSQEKDSDWNNESDVPVKKITIKVPQPLASRWSRLWASMLDGILMMVILMPMMYFMGVFSMMDEKGNLPTDMTIILAVLGVVVFLMINGHYLVTRGQTVGKMALDIRIVDEDGNLPPKGQLIKRYAFYFGISHFPFVGDFLSFASILVIFGRTKQCGHDYFAKTFVISDEVGDDDIQNIIDKRNSQD